MLTVTFPLQMLPSANELPLGAWMPTLRSESSPTATVPEAFVVEPNQNDSTWHCLNCESVDAEPVLGGWQCTQCGSQEFYDPNQPLRSVTARGTWMYMPHGSPEMASPSSSASASSQASRRRRRRRRPPSGNPESDAGERAESEAPTVDPIVVPSEHDFPQSPQVYPDQQVSQVNLVLLFLLEMNPEFHMYPPGECHLAKGATDLVQLLRDRQQMMMPMNGTHAEDQNPV